MGLSAGQVIVITASLAAVGAVAIYFIENKDEPYAAPKRARRPNALARLFGDQHPRRPGHTPQPQHHAPPSYAQMQPQHGYPQYGPQQQSPQYAMRDQPHYDPAPPHYAHPQQHDAPPHYDPSASSPHGISTPPMAHDTTPEHVDYTRTPMPSLQRAHAHEWPRAMPSQDVQPTQSMNPTYWRDLATQLSILPKNLLSVLDAQKTMNALGSAPHGEHLKEDNILGPRTINALSDFQEQHHLPMTGNLDPETAAALVYDMYMHYRVQAGAA